MFNVSGVTTGALVELSSPGDRLGNLKRIIVDIDGRQRLTTLRCVYMLIAFTPVKRTLFTSDSITTNISFMPLYGAVDSEKRNTNKPKRLVGGVSLFEDQITLAVGESASTNSSAKVRLYLKDSLMSSGHIRLMTRRL